MKATSLTLDTKERVTIESELLGTVTVRVEDTFEFEEGLLGFPEATRFALVHAEREGFFWLQSLDHSPLAFVLIDPFEFVSDFQVEIGDKELGELATEDAADIVILAILSLPRDEEGQATVNLQGPIVLNVRKGLGRQVVLADSSYGVRWPLTLRRIRMAS